MPLRPTKPEFDDIPMSAVRKAIAERVLTSLREMPVFHLHRLVDATALVAAREQAKTEVAREELPTYNDFLIRIVARALRSHPRLNAWFEVDTIRIARHVNVGFAVAAEEGVLLPVVFEADTKPLRQIAEETREMVSLAREGKLRASLQQGATFTISNIGPVGIDAFNAIISPPQVAILAVGSMTRRPAVVGEHVEALPAMNLTLTVDHRAIDGADGAQFLAEVASGIEAVSWPGS